MGNKSTNIDIKTLNKKVPVLIWIDQNVNNKENKSYRDYIIKNLKYQIFCFTSVNKAIENLKKIEFIQIFIICSGKAYIEFIQIFKENINDFMICPKIIIFTSNKQKYIEKNKNDEKLCLDHPFYNFGGVENQFKEIIKFLKNEKKNETIEFESKVDELIMKIAQSQIKKYGLDVNNNEEKNDEDFEEFFSEYENNKEKKDDDFLLFSKNKSQTISFPSNYDSNLNNLFPKIENDELNPFKDLHTSKTEILNKFWDGEKDESIQFNFEYIVSEKQLIVPLFLSFYVKKPKEAGVRQFTQYMLKNYSDAEKLVYLFDQLDFSHQIPNEVVSKYWARAYTAETNFYRNMNRDLRLEKLNEYLPFIHMMYEGVKIKSLTYKFNSKLYRGAYFDPKEISLLIETLKTKESYLPGSIVYSKSFLSFSTDLNIAMKFKKNVLLIIEEFKDGAINYPACASVKKFSFIKKEEEILIFPFACFEINRIQKIEEKEKNKDYYTIYLNYLGKYEKFFIGMEPEDLIEEIPENSLIAYEVFNTDIVDEKYKDIFNRRTGGNPKQYDFLNDFDMNENESDNDNDNDMNENELDNNIDIGEIEIENKHDGAEEKSANENKNKNKNKLKYAYTY